MSFPAYTEYKDSGVPWLREVPEHWPIVQSRRYFALRKDRASDGDRQLTASQKWGVIYQDDFMAREGQKVVQVLLNAEILKRVEPNDFVISMRSFQGGIEWCGLSGSISSAYVMLIPNDSVEPSFFRYLFKSKGYIQALQSTSNLVRDGQALRYENFVQVPLPMPPKAEQRLVAAFLDRETAKIDALVAEQERLIALLKEKRQAVISDAVTKGLNPRAPMKDSGIEWLGEIPAHWDVRKLKHLGSISYGIGEPPPYREEGVPLIRATNVDGGKILEEGLVFVDPDDIPERRIFWLTDGDIIVVRSGAHTGDSAIMRSAHLPAIAGFDMVLRASKHTEADYIQYCLLSAQVEFGQIALASMRAAQPHLNAEELGGCMIALPPAQEQRKIVSYLAESLDRLDALLSTAQAAITLLQERRAALISAAVTGKIDVRGLVDASSEMEAA